MAADLLIRTERAEYTSGDIVYGAVYLKISGPTCAHGVRVKFYGYETFMYLSKKHSLDNDWIQDTKEYVASDQITLYEFENPIALGQYVFPFQKRLPMDLPGSTFLGSPANSSAEWKIEIVYGVEASLLGAKEIKFRQNIIVTQPLLQILSTHSEAADGLTETKFVSLSTWLPFVMTNADVRVSIDGQQYHTGDNLRLKLDIETQGIVQPKIESIVFQLLRDLRITFKQLPLKDVETTEAGMTKTLSWLTSSQGPPRLEKEFVPDNTLPSGFVHPEGPSLVVQSCRLVDIDGSKLVNGIQELLIPLKDNRGNDVPATALGNHIWLMYSLKVTIKFQKNNPVILHLPICSVLPRCPEWSAWNPEDWVYDCQVMTFEKSPCFVSQETMESVKFSALPSFHVV